MSHLIIAVLCICRRVTGTKTNKYYCMALSLSGQNCISVDFLFLFSIHKWNLHTKRTSPNIHLCPSKPYWYKFKGAGLAQSWGRSFGLGLLFVFTFSQGFFSPRYPILLLKNHHFQLIYLFNLFWASAFKRDFAEHFTSSRTSPTGGALGMSTW